MKISRFFQAIDVELGQQQALSTVNHRHAIQVLRLKVGEPVILFDGTGGEYKGSIASATKRESAVLLESFDSCERESSLDSTLVLAVIKQDKMDFAIQKAVELGVSHIQPMIAARSVIKLKADRLQKKLQHWQAIIVGACEQSGRTSVPSIAEPLSLSDCLSHYQQHFCIGMLPTSDKTFRQLERPTEQPPIALFIGPEGGFTNEEDEQMQQANVHTTRFGPRILRAETAVIAGLTACQQQWGDL